MNPEKLNEWQEVEETIPEQTPVFSVDDHDHIQFEGIQQTQRTIKKKVAYATLTPHQICDPDKHNFQLMNEGKRVAGRVEVQCNRCHIGQNFVVGYHTLVNGKIIPNSF